MARLQLSEQVDISDPAVVNWVRLPTGVNTNARGRWNNQANLSQVSIQHREKNITIIEPAATEYIAVLLKFLKDVFEGENHHQTRVESMRFLNIILKTWSPKQLKKHSAPICIAILTRLITDRRANLNSLCISALVLYHKRVKFSFCCHVIINVLLLCIFDPV